MVRLVLISAATAVSAFAVGIWAEAALVEHPRTKTRVVSIPSTISPSEMHRRVEPDDLPVQYMQSDYN